MWTVSSRPLSWRYLEAVNSAVATDRVGQCPLCQRQVPLTFHHLIPKKLHRRTRFKKSFSKAHLNQGVFVCRLCHNGIHDHYDEMTLAKQFSTFDNVSSTLENSWWKGFQFLGRQI
jgi:5-methylcytosine-specific restriction endonuclease McrA